MLLIFFLFSKVQSVNSHCVYLPLCHIAIAVLATVLGSLVRFLTKYCHQANTGTNYQLFLNFCEFPRKYQNSAKKANSGARLEIPQPMENCGPCSSRITEKMI